jgi:hypothetical protein
MPKQPDTGHKWVGAVTIPLPPTQVRMAHKRGTFTIEAATETKVAVADVYCEGCRQRYEKVHDKPCSALSDRSHLIGGPRGKQETLHAVVA